MTKETVEFFKNSCSHAIDLHYLMPKLVKGRHDTYASSDMETF